MPAAWSTARKVEKCPARIWRVSSTKEPPAGWKVSSFAGWTGPLQGLTNPITMKVVANTNVVANFIPHGTGGTGTILREFWLNAAGSTPADLRSNSNFPNNPSGSNQLTTLEGPTNFADAYGTRIRGFVHPPVSGAYTFWLASDDGGDLLLSTSDNPASATRIAFVDSWMDDHIGTKGWDRMSSIDSTGTRVWYEPSSARFVEFGSKGPGALASPSRRVLTAQEARAYTVQAVLDGWTPVVKKR